MTLRGGFLLCVLLLLAPGLGALAGGPQPDASAAPCPGFTVVEHQGPSCPAGDGLWWVLLDDGTRLLTHGPDPVPAEAPTTPESDGLDHHAEPVCALPGEHRQVLVYTVPADKSDRSAQMAEPIRNMVRTANHILHREAAEFGAERDYRIECDLDGTMTVYGAILATPSNQDSFATITSELKARGFDDPLAKYWIWHDDRVSGIGGQGNLPSGDTPTMLNGAARGPHYAVTYGYDSWYIMMHENGHNLGAVQGSTPHTSGAGHCNDGRDVMCYRDGGPRSHLFSNQVCTDRTHFDCNHDDYFHPAPPPDNYLHDHWNLGSHLNLFLEVPDRCGVRVGTVASQDALPLPVPGLTEVWFDDLEASCGDRHYRFASPRAAPLLTRDLDVCWYQGTTVLACHDAPDDAARGTIPSGADRARVTYQGEGVAAFVLNIN